jgi:hypothetical protein
MDAKGGIMPLAAAAAIEDAAQDPDFWFRFTARD